MHEFQRGKIRKLKLNIVQKGCDTTVLTRDEDEKASEEDFVEHRSVEGSDTFLHSRPQNPHWNVHLQSVRQQHAQGNGKLNALRQSEKRDCITHRLLIFVKT